MASGPLSTVRCSATSITLWGPVGVLVFIPLQLSPAIIPSLAESIAAITRLGRSIVIAEPNIHHVPAWTRRLYVIERGERIVAGALEDARRDAAVTRLIGGTAS